MDAKRRSPTSRYVVLDGELLQDALSRLGWPDSRFVKEVGNLLPGKKVLSVKSVTKWRQGGSVYKEVYNAINQTLLKALRQYRDGHQIEASKFLMPTEFRKATTVASGIAPREAHLGVDEGEEVTVLQMYDFLSAPMIDAARRKAEPQPFFAAVSTGQYAFNILDIVSKQTIGAEVSPISKVVFRIIRPHLFRALVRLDVIDPPRRSGCFGRSRTRSRNIPPRGRR